MCSYDSLDNEGTKTHLRLILDSGKPFLICVNQADRIIKKKKEISQYLEGDDNDEEDEKDEYYSRDDMVNRVKGVDRVNSGEHEELRNGKLYYLSQHDLKTKILFPHQVQQQPGEAQQLPTIVFTAVHPDDNSRSARAAMQQAQFYSTKQLVEWIHAVAVNRQVDRCIQEGLQLRIKFWEKRKAANKV